MRPEQRFMRSDRKKKKKKKGEKKRNVKRSFLGFCKNNKFTLKSNLVVNI
jgi:hypothetical protein